MKGSGTGRWKRVCALIFKQVDVNLRPCFSFERKKSCTLAAMGCPRIDIADRNFTPLKVVKSDFKGVKKGGAGIYRFGFQGQEKDDEVFGSAGSFINFKYRGYDSRIGRFFAIDPLTHDYPWNSPYAFSENVVINAIELEGLEKVNLFSTEDNLWYVAEANDDEEIIHVYAHANQYWLRDNSPDAPKGDASKINSGKTLLKVLTREGISLENKKAIILHSCNAAKVAKKISESEEFKDKLIIAPTERLTVRYRLIKDKEGNVEKGTFVEQTYIPQRDKNGNVLKDKDGNILNTEKKANFNMYYNGKLVGSVRLPDSEYTYDVSKDPSPPKEKGATNNSKKIKK